MAKRRVKMIRSHAIQRCKERYGIDISIEQYHKMVGMIIRGDDGRILSSRDLQGGTSQAYIIVLPEIGEPIQAIYSKDDRLIMTFIKPYSQPKRADWKRDAVKTIRRGNPPKRKPYKRRRNNWESD